MQDEELLMPMVNYLILEATSFLDEYHTKFIKHSDEAIAKRIFEVKNIGKPIWKKINQWKDIMKYRNEIIAHPWYDNDGQFTLPGLPKYNIPRNWVEIILLGHYMQYLYSIIYGEFRQDIEKAQSMLLENFNPVNPAPDKYSNLNEESIALAKEVHELCKSYGKPYYLKVQQYNFT